MKLNISVFSFIAIISSFNFCFSTTTSSEDVICGSKDDCDANCLALIDHFTDPKMTTGWAVRHDSLGMIYKKFGCDVSAEIGIARAGLTKYLLAQVPSIKEYHAIDPFLGGYDKKDAMSVFLDTLNGTQKETWKKAILYFLGEYKCKFKLHHGLSNDMVKHFANESLDCLFIDGDHTYNGVRDDIVKYYPKVKTGGIIVFDDYSFPFPGLVDAVDYFVDYNKPLMTLAKINKHNNYYVVKPKEPLKFLWEYDPKFPKKVSSQ